MFVRMLPIHSTNAIAQSLDKKIAFSDISQKLPPKYYFWKIKQSFFTKKTLSGFIPAS
ncbi:MAG: hypothetical protein KME40_12685 [Komarekiella atlantica HA4396-MV6]|nr:hypothetical protein [Komarekiella atlantica HA4396-MV6]